MRRQLGKIKISYIFRLFIPVVLFVTLIVISASVFFIRNQHTRMAEYILMNHRASLQRETNHINSHIEAAHMIANYLVNDPDIIKAEAQPENIIQHKLTIPRKLVRHKIASPAIDDIYLYIETTGFIFSSTGLYPHNYSVTSILTESVYLHEFLKNPNNFFKFRNVQLRMPNTSECDKILYTISYSTSVIVCISFNKNLIGSQLNADSISSQDLLLFMIDDDRNILASNIILNEQAFDLTYSTDSLVYGGNKYLTIQEQISDKPIHLVMGIPSHVFIESESSVLLVGFISTALILIFVIILSYVIAKYNYKPIRSLYESVVGKSIHRVNEIQRIDTTIKKIQHENTRVKDFLRVSQRAVKRGLISSLVNGKYQNIDELNKEASLINLELHGKAYWIIVWLGDINLQNIVSLPDPFSQYSSGELSSFCGQLYNENELICFVAANNAQSESSLSDALKKITGHLAKSSYCIGISNCQTELKAMGQALDEARYTAESQKHKYQSLTCYKDLPLIRDRVQHAVEMELLIEKIQSALVKGSNGNLDDAISEFKLFIEKHKESTILQRSASSRLQNLALYVYGHYVDYIDSYEHSFDITNLSIHQSVDELLTSIQALGNQIKDIIISNEIVTNKKYVEQIKRYIQDHCFSYDFSVQGIADHFNISTSTLSRIFHQITGKTMITYVTELRLDKAKEMLVSSDLKISDIVQKVGYLSGTTFSNTFKKYTGVSPNKYRKMHGVANK